MTTEQASRWTFLGASALLFAASAATTLAWCGSMPATGGTPMPGGGMASGPWMPTPGQSQAAAAASFVGMWIVMMAAMMLPSLVPMLERYRTAVGRIGEPRLAALTVLVALGYFLVWTLPGAVAFPLGAALSAAETRLPELARTMPAVSGAAVVVAGALQFTKWKARRLACCRGRPDRTMPAAAGTALRHGLRLGLDCNICCAGLTTVLLAVGVMDIRAMALVTAAITAERLLPSGRHVARVTGAFTAGAGLWLVARATGLG